MKKFLFVFLALFAFFGCSPKSNGSLEQWMNDNGKLKILSTVAQIGDLVEAIGGERVDPWVLISGDLDPHSYELVKGDSEKIQRADTIFYNGLGLEHGASLSSALQNRAHVVAVAEEIQNKSPDAIIYKGSLADPHIWMDISLWKEGVDPIADKLIELDPEGEDYYRMRADLLKKEMAKTHRELVERLRAVPPSKRYLVTSHDAFQYFTRGYLAEANEKEWGSRFNAPEGLAPDGQLTPVDLQKIIDYMSAYRIQVIFPESNVSRDSIRKIAVSAKELGLEVQICSEVLYGDALGEKTEGGEIRYLTAMRHNANTIAEHLE